MTLIKKISEQTSSGNISFLEDIAEENSHHLLIVIVINSDLNSEDDLNKRTSSNSSVLVGIQPEKSSSILSIMIISAFPTMK